MKALVILLVSCFFWMFCENSVKNFCYSSVRDYIDLEGSAVCSLRSARNFR